MDEGEVLQLLAALPGSVGRERFVRLFGSPPTDLDAHRSEFAFDALDSLVPHPAYGPQGWLSVLVPGPATEQQVRELVAHAHERARRRYRRRAALGPDVADDDPH